MKITVRLTAIFLWLFASVNSHADAERVKTLANEVQSLVTNHYSKLPEFEQEDVRDNLLWAKEVFSAMGYEPENGISKIFSCTADNTPMLVRRIVNNSGSLLREDVIQRFSNGYTRDRDEACEARLYVGSELNQQIKGFCQCSNDNQPALIIELVNSDYQTIFTTKIKEFRDGYTSDRIAACEAAKEKLNICTGL